MKLVMWTTEAVKAFILISKLKSPLKITRSVRCARGGSLNAPRRGNPPESQHPRSSVTSVLKIKVILINGRINKTRLNFPGKHRARLLFYFIYTQSRAFNAEGMRIYSIKTLFITCSIFIIGYFRPGTTFNKKKTPPI